MEDSRLDPRSGQGHNPCSPPMLELPHPSLTHPHLGVRHSLARLLGHFLRVQWQRHGAGHLLPVMQATSPQQPSFLQAQEGLPAAEGRRLYLGAEGPLAQSLGLIGGSPELR